ncbi:toprim domain-containing protein [Campylobacter lanienae]|uniref:toprim domain-containing protein n=1 Tax=Campylobacter lanienae TaxID=75658 RepID=UPI000BB43D92|nr:toprim domain-containing protein [Campylobacter lanienae]
MDENIKIIKDIKDIKDIKKLPLDRILINNGYYYDKEKSSQNYKVVKNDNGDKVIISRATSGDYLYFNPNNDSDKGNIYSFCKNRGIVYQDLLNSAKNIEISVENSNHISVSKNKSIDEFKEFENIDKDNLLIIRRKIDDEIQKYTNVKKDGKNNMIIPTFSLSNNMITQVGYTSYLTNPITKDKNGNDYTKPIKQLCYGSKGLEILKSPNLLKIDNIKIVVITESIIDSISYAKINKLDPNTTLICGTNGQVTKSHKEALQWINDKAKVAKYILGFDNDSKGEQFDKEIKRIIPQAQIEKSVFKDFNDDLVMAQKLKIDLPYKTKEVLLKIQELDKKAVNLNKNIENLSQNDRQQQIEYMKNNDVKLYKEIKSKALYNKQISSALERLEKNYMTINKKIDNLERKKEIFHGI